MSSDKYETCINREGNCRMRVNPNLCSYPFICVKLSGCENLLVNGYAEINKSRKIVKVCFFEDGKLHQIKSYKIGNPEILSRNHSNPSN